MTLVIEGFATKHQEIFNCSLMFCQKMCNTNTAKTQNVCSAYLKPV